MQLEFSYQAFKISGRDTFQEAEIISGTVNFKTLLLKLNSNGKLVQVRRTLNNERRRPNAERRHNPVEEEDRRISDAHFIAQEDLEWLSLNYRKERAARLSKSRRRMILIMFQKDISYFPSLKEIRDEIIMAQMELIT